MNKLKNLLLWISLLAFQLTYGQSPEQEMNVGKSYSEICQEMTKRFEGKSFKKHTANYSRAYKQFKRWEYFWKHRLTDQGDFAQPRAIYDAWLDQSQHASLRSGGTADWQFFGPKNLPNSSVTFYPGLGRINAIAIHPSNHNILFAGGAGSGVWKSTDKGATWQPKTDDMPNVGISDIVFDPNNANTIYAATGDADGGRSPFSTGIFKSTDLGETWTIVGLARNPSDKFSVKRMVMPSVPANTIIATTGAGIQRSTDGGASWTVVSIEKGYAIIKATNSNAIFYAGTSDGKILKSIDTGATWTDITPASLNLQDRVELAVTANDVNFVIAFDANGSLGKSNNAGVSWTSLTAPPNFDSQGGYNLTIAVSPNDKNRIMLGGIEGWRTTNGGSTWEKYLNGYWEAGDPFFYVHSDYHCMRFVGNSDTLFVANDGGVFYGDITQNTAFTDITQGLFVTQYYGIGTLRTNDNVLVGGAQDNDGIYINGATAKGLLPGSDGYDGMIDYSNPNISYISTTGGSVEKTTDGWATSAIMTIPGFQSNWEVPMAMHPSNPATIFFGGNQLSKSTDRGANWTVLYTAANTDIVEMAIAPSDGDVIVIFDDVLRRSSNGGQTWTQLSSLPLGQEIVSGIAIHETNPSIIYVSLSGFSAGNKVFKSTDAGQNWTNISHDLPNIPLNHIAYATGGSDDLYVATDLGVYHNTASQTSWTAFNTKMPYVPVYELEIHYGSSSIFAATYGRGIWKSPLASSPPLANGGLGKDAGIKVFPTLNQGVFNIEIDNWNNNEAYELLIYNTIGGVVLNKKLIGKKHQINIAHVVNATYFVSIKKGKKYNVKKIIVHAN